MPPVYLTGGAGTHIDIKIVIEGEKNIKKKLFRTICIVILFFSLLVVPVLGIEPIQKKNIDDTYGRIDMQPV